MKNYVLFKKEIFNLPIKVIRYDFDIAYTSKPTKWIKIVIHHTGNRRTIQQIIDLHVKKNRWSEIGYHFLIGKRGQIYYSRELDRAGAHCYGHNKNSIGIALFGNFDEVKPTERQIESLNRLIDELKKKFPIRKILGHNEAIYKLIRQKFWKLNFEKVDLLNFENFEKYNDFIQKVNLKVLKFNSDKITIDLLKRLKTCPGVNMYGELKEIKKKI